MTTATKNATPDNAAKLIDSIEDAETTSLEAVRKFLDTVNGAFPDVNEEGPRRKIIDSAFKMVEQLIGASNDVARSMVRVTEDVLADDDRATTAKN